MEGASIRSTSFSPDGSTLLLDVRGSNLDFEAYVKSLNDEDPPRRLTEGLGGRASGAQYSPDGRWIAFTSDATGRSEIFLISADLSGRPLQVTTEGGKGPSWNPRGGELFYSRDDALLALQLDTSRSPLKPGEHQLLFEVDPAEITLENSGYSSLHPSPDGNRFLTLRTVSGPEESRIQIVERIGGRL